MQPISRQEALRQSYFNFVRSADIPAPPLFGDDIHYDSSSDPSLHRPFLPANRHRPRNTDDLPTFQHGMQWDHPNTSRSSSNDNQSFLRSGDQWRNDAGPSNGSNASWRRTTYEPTANWDIPRIEKRRSFPHEDPIPVHTLRLVGPFERPETEPSDNRSLQQQPRHYPSSPGRATWVRSSTPPTPPPPPPLPFQMFASPQQRSRHPQKQQRQADTRPQGTWSLDDIIEEQIEPKSLSREAVENILIVDYANSLNDLEFAELVPQVARLADKRKKELAARKSKTASEALLCSLCCDLQMDCVFLDCGHLASCMNCAQKISSTKNECPICRRRVTSLLRIYTS